MNQNPLDLNLSSAPKDLLQIFTTVSSDRGLPCTLQSPVDLCVNSLRSGGTIFFCANGSSAAESQHLAGE
jgi:phosphoheptose isomerase